MRTYRVHLPNGEGEFLGFFCPGCDMPHEVRITADKSPRWAFDGNDAAPTVSPSILVTWTWGPEHEQRRCHSFLRAGRLEFLGDCTHRLAGQTVELPELPEWLT